MITKEYPVIRRVYHIDDNGHGVTKSFIYTDSEEDYEKNLKKQPSDWLYRNYNISYKYNDWGYRTKEISDIDENYFISFGCSYTEGIGLAQKDIWPTLLSNQMGIDCFNLAHGGSGWDIQFHNTYKLVPYLKKINKLPKFVVYQWPDYFRRSFWHEQYEEENMEPIKTYVDYGLIDCNNTEYNIDIQKMDQQWYCKRYLMDTGESRINCLSYFETVNNMWNLLNIPCYNVSFYDDDFLLEFRKNVNYPMFSIDHNSDLARDLAHPGIESHKITSKQIYHIIQ